MLRKLARTKVEIRTRSLKGGKKQLSATFQEKIGLAGVELTREGVRFWGIRSGLSVLDQGLTSGAGFLLNLFLARWLTSDAYGAFAVGFSTVLFLFGFHTALLLEPMSVMGPAGYEAQIVEYFLTYLKLHTLLAVILSVALFLTAGVAAWSGAQRELIRALVGSAIALPFLLLLWLIRRMCYVVHRPSMAAWGSGGYLVSILLGLWVLRALNYLDVFAAFLLMAASSIPAAVVLLWQLGMIRAKFQTPISWKQVLVENWNYGRWLVGGTVLFTITGQIQTYAAAGLLGLGAAGILRATQIPSLLMTQVVTAVGLMMLPAMAHDFGVGRIDRLRKKAALCTLALTGMAVTYALVLALFAKPLEHILYGGKFASVSWLIPALALVPVFAAFATGFSMTLRAVQKPHFDLIANAVSAPVGLITAVVFIRVWGIGGAALSMVAGFAVYALVFFCSFMRWTARTTLRRNAAPDEAQVGAGLQRAKAGDDVPA
jgi:O-antigen/teichoic acid export membrane protein